MIDTRALHTAIESTMDEAGMDIIYSDYRKNSAFHSNILAVDPLTKKRISISIIEEEEK